MGWLSIASSVKEGAVEGAASMVAGLKNLAVGSYRVVTDPVARERALSAATSMARSAAEFGGRLIDDPATRTQAYADVQQFIGDATERFVAAREAAARDGQLGEFYGSLAGRAGFEVATILVPVTKLGNAGKLGAASELVADAGKVAKASDSMAARGAAEAVLRCDEVVASRLAPGGGLTVHEGKARGHLIDKHVGRTEQELRDRFVSEPWISGSSSFVDRATAERVAGEALDANEAKIATWLQGSGKTLPIQQTLQGATGIFVPSAQGVTETVSSVRFILVRDPSMATGYFIKTGFPIRP